jgi:phytanoyl-CoA hydroxylase
MGDSAGKYFSANGFLLLRGCVDPARVQQLTAAIARQLQESIEPAELEADLQYPGAPASRDAAGGATTRRLMHAYARDAVFRAWAHDSAILDMLHTLLGEHIALSQVHHNCIMTKQPRFSSRTGWHQDLRYWAFERGQLISTWLALGPEVAENGCLSFLPGSHRAEIAVDRFDDDKFLRANMSTNQALIASQVTPTLGAGDVVLFHCRTLHAAGPNRTDATKLSLVFTYHAADDQPIPGTRSASLPSIPM